MIVSTSQIVQRQRRHVLSQKGVTRLLFGSFSWK